MSGHESWIDVNGVAEHLGVNRESIYRWIDKQGFPAHRVGRLLRFKLSEVDDWVVNGNGMKRSTEKKARKVGRN